MTYDERNYIDRTIQTVRNHRDAENCWPQWANAFADEIERLRAVNAESERVRRQLAEALRVTKAAALSATVPIRTIEDALAAADALDGEKP